MKKYSGLLSAVCFVLSACDRPAAVPRPVESSGTIDSIFTVAEDVRRFQAAHVTTSVDSLNGVASRDQLVSIFINALENSDTIKLSELALTASEFIELYYPSSPYTRPPYRQSPDFVWFQFEQNGRKGVRRALARYGGQPTGYAGYTCPVAPEPQGDALLWRDCVVRWGLSPDSIRIFGTIIRHTGRYKFVSFANDL